MIGRNNIRIMQHSEDLTEPPRNKNVHPYQCCPMFQTRKTNSDSIMDCFFCKYAYFGLENKVALEVGICRWPNVQMEG